MATPRERKDRKKLTPAQQALAAAKARREQEARNKTLAEQTKKAEAGKKQATLAPSTNDFYEQKARDEGWTDPEAIKYWAAKYRAEAEKKAQKSQPKGQAAGSSMIAGLDAITANVHGLTEERKRSLANTGLYGGVTDASIKARLTSMKNAADEARRARLAKQGNAVYMGPKDVQIRRPFKKEGEFEGGQYRIPQKVQVDNVVDKNYLMAWLADEGRLNDIKSRMQKAGLDVQTYNDVATLWASVLDQSASTYSITGKKVTPWSLLELRGKQMVHGKPAARTTTSTSFDEIAPEQARLIIEKAAQDKLGRTATHEEIDDFIAKAMMIARQNPQVKKTITQYDFAGNPISEISHSTGGAEVASAKAATAAEDAAMQDEDYGAFQAAGVIFPWMSEALQSPV